MFITLLSVRNFGNKRKLLQIIKNTLINKIQEFKSLSQMPKLKELYLQNNEISYIDKDTLTKDLKV